MSFPRSGAVALAAALMAACGAARADFTVNYNAQDRRISIIDNATGAMVITPDLSVHQSVSTLRSSPTDTTIEPTVTWAAHGDPSHTDGLDLTFTFDNSMGAMPARPGPIFVPGIVFGLPSDQLGAIHTRDFSRDGKAYVLSTDRANTGSNTTQEASYPDTLFSPVALLNAGRYAVGVSVLYPVVDPSWPLLGPSPNEYGHRIGLGIWLPNSEGGERAWQLRVGIADADFAGGAPSSTIGFVPPHEVRQYTLAVRVTDRLRPVLPDDPPGALPENEPDAAPREQEWLRLFAPYRDYFVRRYGGINYAADHRPVLGCVTTQLGLVSRDNPYGFAYFPGGGGRPYPDGWGRWHTYLQYQRTRGWYRAMLWTPTGLFPAESPYNFPFQFTSQWSHERVPGGEPTLLRDLNDNEPDGGRLGLWWGNSVLLMDSWPPKPDTGVHLLEPTDPQHQARVREELDGAVNTANASMIGLDAFMLPAWKGYRWLRQLRAWYPGLHFIQEAQPCDIMSTLSPGFIAGTRNAAEAGFAVKTPMYLAELVLPGHEQWASLEPRFLADELGHLPSDEEIVAKARTFGQLGYVPVVYSDIAIAGADAVRPGVVPCDILYPVIEMQPPAEVRVVSGQPVTLSAAFSNEASNDLQWHRAIAPNAWVEIGDFDRVSGTGTPNISFSPAAQSDAGPYRLRARDRLGCVDVLTTTVNLIVCGAPDFNHDGDSATDADIESFFACLGGNCCATCDTTDFNGDGEAGTDADIEAFFGALAGAGC